ncbi:APC family permease [Nocardia sp. NPDC059239]|uniref:APC family permease n=1 Tax=unclassified Nocardia TaxID=2637762 RepID=UPI00368DE19D
MTTDDQLRNAGPDEPVRVETGALPASDPHGSPPKLRGNLGLAGLTVNVLAYASPLALMSGYVSLVIGYGNGLGAPLAIGVTTIVVLIFSVGFGAIAGAVKKPGGFYTYVAAGLGRPVGLGIAFLAIYMYWVVTVAGYSFIGIVSKYMVEGFLHGPTFPWWVWAAVIWVCASTLSYFKIDISVRVLSVLIVGEVISVLAFDTAVFLAGGKHGLPAEPFTFSAFHSGSPALAILFCTGLFMGFEASVLYSEEVRNPERNIPWSMYISVAWLGLLFGGSCYMLIAAVGSESAVDVALDNSQTMFPNAMGTYLHSVGTDIVSIFLVTSVFAGLTAGQNITARYIHSLGVDGVLLKSLGAVHPRHGSPYRAAMAVAALFAVGIVAMVLSGQAPNKLYAWISVGAFFYFLMLMAFSSLAAFFYFLRRPDNRPNAAVWIAAPVVSFLALVAISSYAFLNFDLVTGSTIVSDISLIMGFVVLALGITVALFLKDRRPEVYQRIGRNLALDEAPPLQDGY